MNDSSPHTRGKLRIFTRDLNKHRFIPSCEGQTSFYPKRIPTTTIHPLLRGANFSSISNGAGSCDSSPPTRGKLLSCFIFCFIYRFIPSCEGQTVHLFLRFPDHTIHPLLRGANVILCLDDRAFCDSSPPTRGKRKRAVRVCVGLRFIPSYEGQTLSVYAAFSRLKHIVVQFAQIMLSTHHTSFSLHII